MKTLLKLLWLIHDLYMNNSNAPVKYTNLYKTFQTTDYIKTTTLYNNVRLLSED